MSEAIDRRARRLADGSSRRDILKALGGFLAGGFLLGFGSRAGADDDDPDDSDRDDVCRRYCRSCRHARCGAQRKCLHACRHTLRKNPTAVLCGSCTASKPFTACTGTATCCNGHCINLDSTSTCGTTCQSAVSCGSGDTCCSGTCTDFTAIATCGTTCSNTVKCTGTNPACCSSTCKDLSAATTCGSSCSNTVNCTTSVSSNAICCSGACCVGTGAGGRGALCCTTTADCPGLQPACVNGCCTDNSR